MTEQRVGQSEIERLLDDSGLAVRILNRSFDAVTLGDFDGRILWVNDTLCAQTGLTREQLVGHTDEEFDFYLEPETRVALVVALRDKGRFGPQMARFRVNDEVQHVELFAEVVDVGGQPMIMTISRAITLQVEAESRLREAEITFQNLVEQLPGAVYLEQLHDSTTKHTFYASPRYQEMFGVMPDEDVPARDNWQRIIHPDDLESVIEESDRTDLTEEPYACEYRVIPEGRPIMWVRDEAVLVRDDQGVAQYWLGFLSDITYRVRAEEELRAAEEKLRALVEQIPVAVYTQSPVDYANYYLSPQMVAISGYTIEEFRAEGFWESILHPEDHDEVMAEARRTDETEEPFDMEYRMIGAGGRVIWIHEVSVPVRAAPGAAATLWQGIFEDITERKNAEAKLRAAEERNRALIEHIPVATYTQARGEESGYFMSAQIEGITGWPASVFEEAQGWNDVMHPEDRPWVNAEAERTDALGEPFDLEYRMVGPDGGEVWIHDVAVLIEGAQGESDLWQGVVEDISDRKRSEAQLREAEERYRALVEHVPAVTYQERWLPGASPDSTMIYMSPQTEKILGWPLEEFDLDPALFWDRLIYEEDRDSVVETSMESIRGLDTYEQEYRIVRGDGSVGWVRDEAVRVSTEPDGAQYWHGFLTDITKRKEAEEELEHALRMERHAVERLRTLDELKNTFLNAVSHDLRTPLAAILGLALTLEREDIDLEPNESRDLAKRIASNSRKLEKLVTDLLDLDRLSRGILEPQLATTNLGLLVRKVINELDIAEDRPIIVEAADVLVAIDAAKVERIVENLVANSVRHTPAGTRVWVRVTPENGGGLIAIEDDGPGVPAGMREAIFEPFRQAESPHSHSPGVGIGLSLVARFAELHGGRVWVQDREGGGASFRVFLPGSPAAS
jgi:PAS domain S-box-containing protein